MFIKSFRVLNSRDSSSTVEPHSGAKITLMIDDYSTGNGLAIFALDSPDPYIMVPLFNWEYIKVINGNTEHWVFEVASVAEVNSRVSQHRNPGNRIPNPDLTDIDISENSPLVDLVFYQITGNSNSNETFTYPPGNGSGSGGRP